MPSGDAHLVIEFPEEGPYGYMLNFETWKKYIHASNGNAKMKDRVIKLARKHVLNEAGLLDSFKLGLVHGTLTKELSFGELVDFFATIHLTRNLDNVPIVREPKCPTQK